MLFTFPPICRNCVTQPACSVFRKENGATAGKLVTSHRTERFLSYIYQLCGAPNILGVFQFSQSADLTVIALAHRHSGLADRFLEVPATESLCGKSQNHWGGL